MILPLFGALLAAMQTAERVQLYIPAGACRVILDGKDTAFKDLPAAIARWEDRNPEVHFEPDPHARYQCVDRVLTILKAARVPMRLGFVGNEVLEPEGKQ